MSDWETLSSKVLVKTDWIEVVEDKVLNHKKQELTYTYLRLPQGAVTILAVNKHGEVLLQDDYRQPIGKTLTESQAGHTDGQEPLTAAKRELAEEAGMQSDKWTSLGMIYLSPGVADIPQHLFLAEDIYPSLEDRDDDEYIFNQRFVPLDEVKAMLARFEIKDADTCVALYRYIAMIEDKENT